jgi:hypothetical protein
VAFAVPVVVFLATVIEGGTLAFHFNKALQLFTADAVFRCWRSHRFARRRSLLAWRRCRQWLTAAHPGAFLAAATARPALVEMDQASAAAAAAVPDRRVVKAELAAVPEAPAERPLLATSVETVRTATMATAAAAAAVERTATWVARCRYRNRPEAMAAAVARA